MRSACATPCMAAKNSASRKVRSALGMPLAVDVVDGPLVGSERGFMQRLGERGMRMDRALQVLAAGRIFHREHRLGDELACQWSDDVNTQHLVVILSRNQFDEA